MRQRIEGVSPFLHQPWNMLQVLTLFGSASRAQSQALLILMPLSILLSPFPLFRGHLCQAPWIPLLPSASVHLFSWNQGSAFQPHTHFRSLGKSFQKPAQGQGWRTLKRPPIFYYLLEEKAKAGRVNSPSTENPQFNPLHSPTTCSILLTFCPQFVHLLSSGNEPHLPNLRLKLGASWDCERAHSSTALEGLK